jgi:hypothetical protein
MLVKLFIHYLDSYSPSNGNNTRYNTTNIVKTPISDLLCLLLIRIMTALK